MHNHQKPDYDYVPLVLLLIMQVLMIIMAILYWVSMVNFYSIMRV